MLLDVEDDVTDTNDKDIPRKVYIGQLDVNTHFCYWDTGAGFLATFDSPNIGRMVASKACVDMEQMKEMTYLAVDFNYALALSLSKAQIVGVIHFFNEDQSKKVYNGN